MKRRDFLRHSATGVLAAGLAAKGAWAGAASSDPVYALTFPDLNGRPQQVADWLGKPLVLNFWATWCPPCVREMPALDALHEKYDAIQFAGLAIDTVSNVRKFVETVKVSYPLLMSGHGGIALMRSLGNKVGGLPFTVVFDARGQVAEVLLGEIEPASLEQTLQHLIS